MYNSAATIRQTIDSLRAQTLPDWRAVVIDDGSTDDSAAIVAAMAAADDRITLLRQANAGVVAARNAAFGHARHAVQARYLMLLDSDDYLAPDALARLVAAAESAGGAEGASPTGAYGEFDIVDDAGAMISRVRHLAGTITLDDLLIGVFLVPHCHIVPFQQAVATGFDPQQPVVEDTDYAVRCALRGVRWAPVRAPSVAFYRSRPGSLSRNLGLMLSCSVRCFTRAFTEARKDPRWAGLDLSEDRLSRMLLNQAVLWSARRAAGADPDGVAGALAMFRSTGLTRKPSASTLVKAISAAAISERERGDIASRTAMRTARGRIGAWLKEMVRAGHVGRGAAWRAWLRLSLNPRGPLRVV